MRRRFIAVAAVAALALAGCGNEVRRTSDGPGPAIGSLAASQSAMSGEEKRAVTYSGEGEAKIAGEAELGAGTSAAALREDDNLCIRVDYSSGSYGKMCRPIDMMKSLASAYFNSPTGERYVVAFIDPTVDEVKVTTSSSETVSGVPVEVAGLSGVKAVAVGTGKARALSVSGYSRGQLVLDKTLPPTDSH